MLVVLGSVEMAQMPRAAIHSEPVVKWAELLPEEFEARLAEKPVVYMPMGLCEPHGHVAPFGLDTLKAEYLCNEAAARFGGIVAPTMSYQIHETGYHAPWLEHVIGEVNPRLASLPPHVVLEALLYQLRAFRNAGFKAVVVLTGHGGGNEHDLRMVAQAFAGWFPLEIFVCVDPELVAGEYVGDHAGKVEVSQMLAIRPELVRLDRADRAQNPRYGQMAQNADANQASPEFGREILEAELTALGHIVASFRLDTTIESFISLEDVQPVWEQIALSRLEWRTLRL